jgi:uncharacterized membrane protein HdeD (DUF308 family)
LFAISVIAEGIAVLAGAWQARDENKNWWVDAAGRDHQYCGRHHLHCQSRDHCTVFRGIDGVSWLVTGLIEIYAAISLRKEITNEGWLALAGILSVLSGLFLIFRTEEGALALVWLIAGFAIVFGIILILLALKAKNWVGGMVSR